MISAFPGISALEPDRSAPLSRLKLVPRGPNCLSQGGYSLVGQTRLFNGMTEHWMPGTKRNRITTGKPGTLEGKTGAINTLPCPPTLSDRVDHPTLPLRGHDMKSWDKLVSPTKPLYHKQSDCSRACSRISMSTSPELSRVTCS